VHEGGWRIVRDGEKWRVFRPDGIEVVAAIPRVAPEAVANLCATHGPAVTPDTLTPTWDGRPPDFGWAANALHGMQAHEPPAP
jgi:hypothetical protein